MSSGATIGIATGLPGTQRTFEQTNLERRLKENAERIKTSFSTHYQFFTPVQFNGTVTVNGETRNVSRKVYQRHDIDFHYVDPDSGLSNLERMKKGRPPIGNDGNPIQLHHVIQREAGPMVEIRELTHQEYYATLHGLVTNGMSFRNDPLMTKQYNNFRSAYWKWRAQQYANGGHNDE